MQMLPFIQQVRKTMGGKDSVRVRTFVVLWEVGMKEGKICLEGGGRGGGGGSGVLERKGIEDS